MITSEIIGKLGGGADVQSFHVEGTASGGSNSTLTLATIEIPAGETWLVTAMGVLTGSSSSLGAPYLVLGDVHTSRFGNEDYTTVAAVCAGNVELKILRRGGSGSDSFAGTVYTVKL